jgi:dihydroorotate dehydrogenase (NAD+) catalytic subunit
MANLEIQFLNKTFQNPLVLASGIMGSNFGSLVRMSQTKIGAITTKSVSIEAKLGHPNPIVVEYEHGFLNCVGLANGGIEKMSGEIKKFRKEHDAPILLSIFENTGEKFVELAKKASELPVDFLEINISCPNVEKEFGKPIATDPDKTYEVVSKIKEVSKLPIIVKLSPNVHSIVEVGLAAEKAGADAICAINTIGPGMLIDLETQKPILSNKVGGVSGPAIRPVAIKCIYDLYQNLKIPILGMGGVSSAEDVLELMLAGATLVGMGSAVYYEGIEVFTKINDELNDWLDKHNINNIADLIGQAH